MGARSFLSIHHVAASLRSSRGTKNVFQKHSHTHAHDLEDSRKELHRLQVKPERWEVTDTRGWSLALRQIVSNGTTTFATDFSWSLGAHLSLCFIVLWTHCRVKASLRIHAPRVNAGRLSQLHIWVYCAPACLRPCFKCNILLRVQTETRTLWSF